MGKSPATSAHEADILRAVAAGATLDTLLNSGWSSADVVAALHRHGLVATDTGSVVRADTDLLAMLQDALLSESPAVRKAAGRADAHLRHLRRLLGTRHAAAAAEDVRRRQVEAVQDWLEWLAQADTIARGELRRLKSGSPRSPHNRASRDGAA
jgi:hypothetical protein